MSIATQSIYDVLQAHADKKGVINYAQFTNIALYDPQFGYYALNKERVGRNSRADFYTASSLSPLFGELVRTAAKTILGDTFDSYTFVEIGAEPRCGVTQGITYRLGDTLKIPPKAIVFANELLDAQPFHRFIFKEDRWQELGVCISGMCLEETLLESPTPELEALASALPNNMPEDYQLDISLAAETLLASLLGQPWTGLCLFFDYGKTWQELLSTSPAGTARAYHKHTLSNKLLEHPGEQDLTAHVCWDRCLSILNQKGFVQARCDTQEAFFVHHAQSALRAIVEQGQNGFSEQLQTLKELLHPGHMGQKFQVMWGVRL